MNSCTQRGRQKKFREWFLHPLLRGRDVFDPADMTQARWHIIRENGYLRQIYHEWYTAIVESLPDGEEPVLELGSGPGLLSDFIPDLISSEVFHCLHVHCVLNGCQLPFSDGSLRGIVMVNVLHHLPQVRLFLTEAIRCIRPGGVVVMHEPWVTHWSQQVYRRLHFEPFHPEATEWRFARSGPLSGANLALPWIIFERDRSQFEREFPELHIQRIKPVMGFRYFFSGGVTFRNLMPKWTSVLGRGVENVLQPWVRNLAMFAQITLHRRK